MSSALVDESSHSASQSSSSWPMTALRVRFICWQISDWRVRGWREVKSRERGVAMMGVAVAARRLRMRFWSCIFGLYTWCGLSDYRV